MDQEQKRDTHHKDDNLEEEAEGAGEDPSGIKKYHKDKYRRIYRNKLKQKHKNSIISNCIINLSTHNLTNYEKLILHKGLSFIPRPRNYDRDDKTGDRNLKAQKRSQYEQKQNPKLETTQHQRESKHNPKRFINNITKDVFKHVDKTEETMMHRK